ncbi:MAG: ATP synthase F1 subunit delta [bacterium]
MSDFSISTRYAQALMQVADEKSSLSKISSDVELLFKALNESKDLRYVLRSPVIDEDKKVRIMEEIFTSRISEDSLSFIKLILKKKRENLLLDISKRFLELRDNKLGLMNILVTSAVEMTEVQKESLKKKLSDETGKVIKLNFEIDENIIGGFLLKIGDTVIDATIRNQILKLKKCLLQESLSIN